MNKPIEQEISALTIRYEANKQQLLEKMAERAVQRERFFVYGESEDLKVRATLDAQIACLEADKQRMKVERMKLKNQARDVRRVSLVRHLIDALKRNGLEAEVLLAQQKADEDLKSEGLQEAYSISL